MKPRKPLRRTPLKRSTKPLKRSAIKRKPVNPEQAKARKKLKRERQKASDYSIYWRDKATKVWSKLVRIRAGGYCERTGKRCTLGELDAHHLVMKGISEFRCDLFNGMAIKKHFHAGPHCDAGAPHGAQSHRFYEWLMNKHPEKYAHWLEHKNDNPRKRMNWKNEFDRLDAIYKEAIGI